MKRFEEFKVGDSARLKHRITASDVERFVELTGDDNPLHVDADYADNSPMKGIVTHGMLSASFLSTMIGKHLPGPGALWVSQNIEFLLPVRIDDELDVQAEIVEIHASQRLIKLKARITNQRGKDVLTGECLVKVLDVAQDDKHESAIDTPGCVIVTGASRGIGAAIAKCLAEQGVRVVVNARTMEKTKAIVDRIVQAGGVARGIAADVTDRDQVDAMIDEAVSTFGAIDGLVNNAAPQIIERAFDDLSWKDCAQQIEAQAGAAFNCIQAVVPHMRARGYGAIVNVGSIVVDQAPPPKWLAYNMAKSAMHALTKNLAESLGPDGIRINTVAPGLTDTAFVAEMSEKSRILAKMQTPLRRLAEADDIAEGVAFLLSDRARHITGETLRMNGGKTLI